MSKNLYTHYDFEKIAKLCEQSGLYQRALQHYLDISQAKRILISYGSTMQPDFVANVFQRYNSQERLDLLRELLKTNLTNVALVAAIAVKFTPPPGNHDRTQTFAPGQVVALFEEFESYDGIYQYLKPIIPIFYLDKDVVFKFIEVRFFSSFRFLFYSIQLFLSLCCMIFFFLVASS
jgi:clathrin heavy chain